jgi:hypothetical protein
VLVLVLALALVLVLVLVLVLGRLQSPRFPSTHRRPS